MSQDQSLTGYVLLIEDDAAIRDTIQMVFDFLLVPIRSVSHGAKALEFLSEAEHLPFLILLDLRMPVMDGEAFRRRQLGSPELRLIPTVLLSADTHVDSIAKSLDISEVLTKPFAHEDLVRTIEKYRQSPFQNL